MFRPNSHSGSSFADSVAESVKVIKDFTKYIQEVEHETKIRFVEVEDVIETLRITFPEEASDVESLKEALRIDYQRLDNFKAFLNDAETKMANMRNFLEVLAKFGERHTTTIPTKATKFMHEVTVIVDDEHKDMSIENKVLPEVTRRVESLLSLLDNAKDSTAEASDGLSEGNSLFRQDVGRGMIKSDSGVYSTDSRVLSSANIPGAQATVGGPQQVENSDADSDGAESANTIILNAPNPKTCVDTHL